MLHADPDLAGLGRLASLRKLQLGPDWRPGEEGVAWAELSALENLQEIAVSVEALAGLAEFVRLPSLRRLRFYEDNEEEPWETGLEERVLSRFPRAELSMVPQAYGN